MPTATLAYPQYTHQQMRWRGSIPGTSWLFVKSTHARPPLTALLVLLVTITMTKSQILTSKLPKLQDQNMTIFQTLYWVLPQWNYHGGTAPGRMEECCNAFYMQFLVFSVLILIVCHTLRQLSVQNSILFLKISGIAIVNHTGTAPGHVGQCFNALAFCIFSCSYSKKWYF